MFRLSRSAEQKLRAYRSRRRAVRSGRSAVVRAAYLRARGVAEGRARRSEDGGGGSDGETDALSCDLIAFPLAGSARALGRICSCYEASARSGVTTIETTLLEARAGGGELVFSWTDGKQDEGAGHGVAVGSLNHPGVTGCFGERVGWRAD